MGRSDHALQRLRCLRCGEMMNVALPCPLPVMIAIQRAWRQMHLHGNAVSACHLPTDRMGE